MTAKRQSPVIVRNPGAPGGASGLSIFQPLDIPVLASAAGRSLMPEANCWTLVRSLDMAFLRAHAATVLNKKSPPPAEMREAFDAVERSGNAFLLALGVEDAASTIASERELIARKSGVLTALIYQNRGKGKNFPDDVINSLVPLVSKMTLAKRRTLAGDRLLVESARAVAYAISVARAAKIATSRKQRRRGPTKDAFSPVLLEKLVECYLQMFGQLPVVERKATAEGNIRRRGYALSWLDAVLSIARNKLSQSLATGAAAVASDGTDAFYSDTNEPERQEECIASTEIERAKNDPRAEAENERPIVRIAGFRYFSIEEYDELVRSVSSLAENEVDTLGRKLEAAIRRFKSKTAPNS